MIPDNRSPNSGHGHVYPRPDGVRARCGGPALCGECAKDFVRKQSQVPGNTLDTATDEQGYLAAAKDALEMMRHLSAKGYSEAVHAVIDVQRKAVLQRMVRMLLEEAHGRA